MQANGKHICGATKKDGTPCQNAPVTGRERCRMHGGKQPRGHEHHNFKHGLFSKYVGSQLNDIISELDELSDEEIVSPLYELKLYQALLFHSRLLKDGINDIGEITAVTKILNTLIQAKQRSQIVLIEQNRLIPTRDIELFLSFLEELLMDETDYDTTQRILDKLKTFKLSNYENRQIS